jgi:hypothetical protein
MTAGSEVQKKDDVLPGLIECLDRVATDSSVSALNRLEAIEILLRLAIGPRSRSADSTDLAASRDARIALSDAAPFLHQVMESNNRARIRLHAASVARFVGQLPGRAGHGSHPQRPG